MKVLQKSGLCHCKNVPTILGKVLKLGRILRNFVGIQCWKYTDNSVEIQYSYGELNNPDKEKLLLP